jgi:hypothetical protein
LAQDDPSSWQDRVPQHELRKRQNPDRKHLSWRTWCTRFLMEQYFIDRLECRYRMRKRKSFARYRPIFGFRTAWHSTVENSNRKSEIQRRQATFKKARTRSEAEQNLLLNRGQNTDGHRRTLSSFSSLEPKSRRKS